MLIPARTLAAIEAGTVTLAFRRWTRPRVRAGTRLRTAVGLVEILAVDQVEAAGLTADDARDAGFESVPDLIAFLARRSDGAVYRIAVRHAGPDPRVALRQRNDLSQVELARIADRLARLDRASPRGPWTILVLRLIAERPAVRAPDLAEHIGWEKATFKRQVRRLKELGLTESLDIGYRLAPRGTVVLDAIDPRPS
jgi:hypothetical protein